MPRGVYGTECSAAEGGNKVVGGWLLCPSKAPHSHGMTSKKRGTVESSATSSRFTHGSPCMIRLLGVFMTKESCTWGGESVRFLDNVSFKGKLVMESENMKET